MSSQSKCESGQCAHETDVKSQRSSEPVKLKNTKASPLKALKQIKLEAEDATVDD